MKYLPIALLLAIAPLFAAPMGWRMDGCSLFPTASPQTQWGVADRVVWATALPQWSNSSPVLVKDRLFVTAEPSQLICLDRAGSILWQRSCAYEELLTPDERKQLTEERQAAAVLDGKIATARKACDAKRGELTKAENDAKAAPDDAALQEKVTALKGEIKALEDQMAESKKYLADYAFAARWRVPITHPTNGYSSNTPVSDGQFVYTCYGNGMVAGFTLDGACRWMRLLEKPTHGWGQSGSPVLVGETLVVQLVNTFGLDVKTGEIRWQTKRPHIWGTPAVTRIGQYDALLTDGGEIINAADGATLATTGMRLEFNSPLINDDVAYCVSGNTARAFRLGTGENGVVTVTKLWEAKVSNDRYYASPLLYNGLLYVLNQQGKFSALDAATGELAYESALKLGGTCYPTPILAGNVIIAGSDSGKFVVITPGREYQEVARPVLEPFRGTPICDGARMYIRTCTTRTPSKLYCIGE
ncbi:MAG: outer membrane protein assembly factor BamB family protein [Armatimonadota bacterium]